MANDLYCWRCGAPLAALPVPLGRVAGCPGCGADLHACRMCRFFDPAMTRGCREPMAESVQDRDRANFCDWFQARPGPRVLAGEPDASHARAELDALFGLPADTPRGRPASDADAAREALERLFGRAPRGED